MSRPAPLPANFNAHKPGSEFDHLATNYQPIDLNLMDGTGPYLVGQDGEVYLDVIGGYGADIFGHKHPEIVAAMQTLLQRNELLDQFVAAHGFKEGKKFVGPTDQMRLANVPTRRFTTPLLAEFSQELAEFSRIPDAVVLPKNGGGEIVESAFKAMRADGVRRRGIPKNEGVVIAFSNCFHGRTYSAVATSDSEAIQADFGPHVPNVIKVPYNDAEALRAAMDAHKGKISGVLIEPVQGEAGVMIPDEGYLQAVQDMCAEYNTILCLDEIQSGFGRTGKRWAWEHSLTEAPDMVVTAKALGAGIEATSALVGKRKIMEIFTPGSDGATMSGHPMGCVVGLAAMKILEDENLCDAGVVIGEHLETGLGSLRDHDAVVDVRIIGSWGAIEVETEEMAEAISNWLVVEKNIVCTSAHESIRLSPPLNIPLEDVDYVAKAIVEGVDLFHANPEMVASYNFADEEPVAANTPAGQAPAPKEN